MNKAKLKLTPQQKKQGFRIEKGHLFDINNNSWNLEKFSIERAINSSKSLSNCKNCCDCANS